MWETIIEWFTVLFNKDWMAPVLALIIPTVTAVGIKFVSNIITTFFSKTDTIIEGISDKVNLSTEEVVDLKEHVGNLEGQINSLLESFGIFVSSLNISSVDKLTIISKLQEQIDNTIEIKIEEVVEDSSENVDKLDDLLNGK